MVERILRLALFIGVLCCSAAPVQAAFVIGAFDASRAGDGTIPTGKFTEDAVAAITTSFPGVTFATAPTLTSGFLSGVDILMLAAPKNQSTQVDPLTADEQTALVNFVKAGGRAILFGERGFSTATRSFMDPFDVAFANSSEAGVFLVDPLQPVHPIFSSPFGAVPQVVFYSAGKLNDLGPYAVSVAESELNGDNEIAVIESHLLGPNSGRVIFMSDSTPFFDTAEGGLFGVQEHQRLLLNSIHYLATPEPSSVMLAVLGGGGLVVGNIWRRRR